MERERGAAQHNAADSAGSGPRLRASVPQGRRRILYHGIGVLVALAALTVVIAACNSGTSKVSLPPTRPPSAASPTETPHLAGLDVEQGWHVVLDLGQVRNGIQNVGGSFVSTHLYMIEYVCAGNGKFTLSVAPAGTTTTTPRESQTVDCASPAQRGRIVQSDIPADQGLAVDGTSDSGVLWHALVEVQD